MGNEDIELFSKVFEGREIAFDTFINILKFINYIESKDDLDTFIVEFNNLTTDITTNTINDYYGTFLVNFFKILDNLIRRYGIVITTDEKNMILYEDLLSVIYNIKNIDVKKEELDLIINGDFEKEDKLDMILGLFIDNTIEIIDAIDVSEMFYDFIKTALLKPVYVNVNIELVTRALNINSILDIKETVIFKEIINNIESVDKTLKADEKLILDELYDRININYSDLDNNSIIKEIVGTILVFNKDDTINIKLYTDDKYLKPIFKNKDLSLIKSEMNRLFDNYYMEVL